MTQAVALLVAALGYGLLSFAAWASEAARIDALAPAAARVGEQVTISGIGFGALNLSIAVGGVPAEVRSANGHSATFVVPSGLPPGLRTIVVTNPGGQTGSIELVLLEGALLPGDPNASAIESVYDLPPVAVDQTDVANGLILTRLNVRLAEGATVGQANDALRRVQGGIVSMTPGFLELTIAVPRPAGVAALQADVDVLNHSPGIAWAFLAHEAAAQVLPPVLSFLNDELLPSRFPAAWNAKRLATGMPGGAIGPLPLVDCTQRKVPVLVADKFVRPAPGSHIGFAQQIPNFLPSPPDELGSTTHGYDVTTTLAALFDDHNPTGANPFPQCLDITGVQISGLGTYAYIDRIVRNFPAGKFVLNFSIGYLDGCQIEFDATTGRETCDPDSITGNNGFPGIPTPFSRAADALYWKAMTHARSQDFVAAASAGNAADSQRDEGFAATIYPGLEEALPNSTLSAATDLDPFYGFIENRTLWSNPNFPDLPDLTATPDQVTRLHDAVVSTGMDRVGPSSNVMIVGSATQGASIAALRESKFSNLGSDLLAVGENVVTFSGVEQGTSFSAPQVAGLASYLWLLSPTLRSQASAATVSAIIANTGAGANGNEILDAYATVLSLDQAALPTPTSAPVRLAILDVNDDGKFDENDLQLFVAQYLDANGNALEPSVADYGRFDLNGDGFTGGSGTARFDLDRTGSTQFGATHYASDVEQQIEGHPIHFDENALTDLQILCYYAYSSLYTGDAAERAHLLAGCAGVQVKVTPKDVTLVARQSQQFSAQVTGANDVRITWSVDGVDGGDAIVGTISDGGIYTAPSDPGTHTVRATSVEDTSAFGEATVTVASANGLLTQSGLERTATSANGDFFQTSWSFSANVTLALNAQGAFDIDASTASGTFNEVQTLTRSVEDATCVLVLTITGTFSKVSGAGLLDPLSDTGLLFLSGSGTQAFSGTKVGPGGCVDGTEAPTHVTISEDVGSTFGGTTGLPFKAIRDGSGRLVELDFNRTQMLSPAGATFTITTTGLLQLP